MAKVIGLIPVRLESTRLPEKPLKDICGLPMIVHVYKRTIMAKSLDDVYVVTDNKKIAEMIEAHGGKCIMTGTHHETGSDRINEAAEKIDCDYVVNIQGDEALVDPKDIDTIVNAVVNDSKVEIGLLVTPFKKYNSPSDIKTVVDLNNNVMYFSRSDIPSTSRTPNALMLKAYHIVPFKKEFLKKFASWEKTPLEKIEYIEYMRVLEHGHKIKTVKVDSDAVSVDTQDDLDFVRSKMPTDPIFALYKDQIGK
ncbi:MAG: 3-deoxy-manno-octulosonate cytidylyltransferase [Bacteriovoracaceae bacterium]